MNMFSGGDQAQKCSLFLIALSGAETFGNTEEISKWPGLFK